MQSPRDKVFITCAVTGNLTLPEQTPHLPITPEEIADTRGSYTGEYLGKILQRHAKKRPAEI